MPVGDVGPSNGAQSVAYSSRQMGALRAISSCTAGIGDHVPVRCASKATKWQLAVSQLQCVASVTCSRTSRKIRRQVIEFRVYKIRYVGEVFVYAYGNVFLVLVLVR